MLSSKKILFVILPTLLVLTLGYFLFLKPSMQANQVLPVYQGPMEKIVIGNIGEYSIFNIIAKEKGFFTENGLDATVIEYPSGPPAMTALLTQEVDVTTAAAYVGVINLFDNPQIRILSEESKHSVFQVLGLRGHDITTPADLKGKKIGVTKKSAGEYFLGLFLTFHHVSIQDVKIIDLQPMDIVEQLKDGRLDAAVIFDPHAYNLKKELGDDIIEWSAQGDQKIYALTYTTEAFIARHPDTALRYIRALVQAETFATHYPDEARTIVGHALSYQSDYLQYMWDNFMFTHGLEQELLFSMESQARWAIDNHLTTTTRVPNYLNFIYFDALAQAKPGAISIIH